MHAAQAVKLFVKAKPAAKEAKLEARDDSHFAVAVKEPPLGGRANRAIAKALALHLGVAPGRVRLVSGFSSRQKVFELI